MKNLASYSISKTALLSTLFAVILLSTFAFKSFKEKPVAVVTLLKQNILYVGVDNPLTIVVHGIPAEKVVVKAEGMTIEKKDDNNYIARTDVSGGTSVTVSGEGMQPVTFNFRAKRVPNPTLLLGARHRSGSIEKGRFVVEMGIATVLENFDFEAQCKVIDYGVTYLAKNQEPVSVMNNGARYNDQALELIKKAQSGDTYIFDDVHAQCVGDIAARSLGSMVFRIK